MSKMKLQTISVATLSSTVSLKKRSFGEETSAYDPFAHRKVAHPTT